MSIQITNDKSQKMSTANLEVADPQVVSRNKYVSKKTIAQGMFDVALLSSNANQLVHLISINSKMKSGEYSHVATLRSAAIVLLSVSIFLQIVVGVCLISIAILDTQVPRQKPLKRKLNNVSTILVFLVTVISVIIPSFTQSGGYEHSPESVKQC